MTGHENSESVQAFALQIQDLRGKLDAMGTQQQSHITNTNNSMAELRGDVRALGGKLEAIAALSHQSGEHTDSIRRIWSGIEKRDLQIQQAVENSRRVINLSTGAGVVATALIAILVYLYQQDRSSTTESLRLLTDRIEKMDERADRIEIYLAGDRVQPYRR